MRILTAAFLLMFLACAGDEPPDDDPDDLRSTPGGLDRNRLLEDTDIEGGQAITTAQVQALLEKYGSALATFSEGGKTAAQTIVGESLANGISPLYMVARIETESSLIRSGTLSKIRQATGCGCPDGAACDPAFAAFNLQVRCAAQLIRGYLTDLTAKNSTITGWGVGVGKSTSDPCWVVPANRATAALYTYTPWVGHYAAGCGTSQWGGSSLVGVLVGLFRADLAGGGCPQGNGLYCGGHGVAGSASTLYRCTNGALTVQASCSAGCLQMPAGQNDSCVDSTQTCTQGNGLYCGGNGITGNTNTLYRCENGNVSVHQVCGTCTRKPAGQNDTCS